MSFKHSLVRKCTKGGSWFSKTGAFYRFLVTKHRGETYSSTKEENIGFRLKIYLKHD